MKLTCCAPCFSITSHLLAHWSPVPAVPRSWMAAPGQRHPGDREMLGTVTQRGPQAMTSQPHHLNLNKS